MISHAEFTLSSIFLWRNQQFINNPYPYYQYLRDQDELIKTHDGMWLVSRYQDIKAILQSADFIRGEQYRFNLHDRAELRPMEHMRKHWLPFLDPPIHKKLKQLIHQSMYACVTPAFRTTLQAISRDLLVDARKQKTFDVIKTYAYPFPVLMISELLGLPREHWEQLKKWSAILAATLEPYPPSAKRQNFDTVAEDFYDYLTATLQHTEFDRTTVLGQFLEHLIKQAGLTTAEVIYATIFLFASGHETISSLLANGLLAFTQFPEETDKVCSKKIALSTAIEELLRFDSPVQLLFQVAAKNVLWGKQTIKAGDQVVLMLGSANRDKAIFNEPDRLQLNRHPNPHLAFGSGAHMCIGAKLARTVAEIAFTDLLQLWPFTIDEAQLIRKPTAVLRGLLSCVAHCAR